jgi:ABC-2 type transport system ATP-binding protein
MGYPAKVRVRRIVRHGDEHVTAVIQYTRNSYSLQLDDGSQTDIPMSKQSERALQDLLGY